MLTLVYNAINEFIIVTKSKALNKGLVFFSPFYITKTLLPLP